MKIFLFLILLSLSCKSVEDSKPIENLEDKALIKKWIVTPESGLNLRDTPSRKGKSIRLLPRRTMVIHKQTLNSQWTNKITFFMSRQERLQRLDRSSYNWLMLSIRLFFMFKIYIVP